MRIAIYPLLLLAVSCAPQDDGREKAADHAISATAAEVSDSGNPEPAEEPIVCGDGSGSGQKNARSCYFAACKEGDKRACEIMADPRPVREQLGRDDGSPRLEDMDYLEARKIILGFGWVPLGGKCQGVMSDESCRQFPELGNCSGTGLGFCDMTFRRADRCLTVVTTGGEPSRDNESSAQVDWVRFYGGPCSKDPNAVGD